jgi:hypothetical protein
MHIKSYGNGGYVLLNQKVFFFIKMEPNNMFLDAISKGNAMLWNHPQVRTVHSIVQLC